MASAPSSRPCGPSMARYWAVVTGILLYCLQTVDGRMSVSIDWSSSTEDGVAMPHVHVPDAVGTAPGTDAILGYYANSGIALDVNARALAANSPKPDALALQTDSMAALTSPNTSASTSTRLVAWRR